MTDEIDASDILRWDVARSDVFSISRREGIYETLRGDTNEKTHL